MHVYRTHPPFYAAYNSSAKPPLQVPDYSSLRIGGSSSLELRPELWSIRSPSSRKYASVHVVVVVGSMLQTLKSLAIVQRQACAQTSAHWSFAAASSYQQIRYFSSTETPSAASGDEAIMGVMGTSVTKKLWQERLTKNKDRLKHLPLPTPTPKLPQQTAVTYAFSSDRFLQEQASHWLEKIAFQ